MPEFYFDLGLGDYVAFGPEAGCTEEEARAAVKEILQGPEAEVYAKARDSPNARRLLFDLVKRKFSDAVVRARANKKAREYKVPQETRRQYYQTLIDRGGGMICCGEHLGVMIGSDMAGCPKAWCFVPVEIATVELVEECVLWASLGRTNWPKNAKHRPKNADEMLEQVFDSQDYIGT